MESEFEMKEEQRLDLMQEISGYFYSQAVYVNCHPFVEFAGFMNEYINICRHNHVKGKDFIQDKLSAENYHIMYLSEKFECIFGDLFRSNKEFQDIFKSKMGWEG